MKQTSKHNVMLGLLMLLGLNLSGCASKSPPVVCPPLPAAPSVTMQQPSKPYSESVQQDLSGWQKRLMDTPLIPER